MRRRRTDQRQAAFILARPDLFRAAPECDNLDLTDVDKSGQDCPETTTKTEGKADNGKQTGTD